MKKVLLASLLFLVFAPGLAWSHEESNLNDSVHLTLLVVCVAPIVYFLPSIVAASQSHPKSNSIFLVNLLLGWSIIGWVAAVVWAGMTKTRPAEADHAGLLPVAGAVEQAVTQPIENALSLKIPVPVPSGNSSLKKGDLFIPLVRPPKPYI